MIAGGTNVTGRYALDADGSADGQVVLSADTALGPRDEVRVEIGAVNDSIDTETITPGVVDVTVADAVVSETDATTNIYENATVAFLSTDGSADHDQAFEVETDAGAFVFAGRTGPGSQAFVFDTAARNWSGTYAVETYLADGSVDRRAAFSIRDLGLGVAAADRTVTTDEAIEGAVLANAAGRSVEIELRRRGDGGAVVARTNRTLSGNGETPFEFPAESVSSGGPGNYTVNVTDVGTGAIAGSERIRVVDAAARTAALRSAIVTEHTGDVADVVVDLTYAETATVTVGSPAVGFRANVTAADRDGDGSVRLRVNTAAAVGATGLPDDGGDVFDVRGIDGGDSPDEIIAADLDDDNRASDALDPGEYGLSVRAGEDSSDAAEDFGTLVLERPAPGGITNWVAPAGTELDDYRSVSSAIDEGRLTRAADAAVGDVVVHRIVAPGLAGEFVRGSGSETERFFALGRTEHGDTDGDQFALNVTRRNRRANAEAYRLDLNETNSRVVADPDNDTYVLAYETGDALFASDSDGDTRIPDAGDDLTAAFAVRENGTFADLDDDRRTVESEYSLVAAEIGAGREPVVVLAAANQSVTGTTTVAPGTQITIRIRSAEGVEPRFLKTARAVVETNGSWAAAFDFEEQRVGDTFTVASATDVLDAESELAAAGEVRATLPVTETDAQTATPAGSGGSGGAPEPRASGASSSGDETDASSTPPTQTTDEPNSDTVVDATRKFVGGVVGTFVDDDGETLRRRLLGFDALLSLSALTTVALFVWRRR
ncbi:BGTF surface domain-containing protein [Halobellus sp. GM3]|uniref:BGTF surface domain-containing protein n=1 Tax=Halobellus sp. GM3 TaxID=3458410 RepID=UPI00403DE3EA